MALSETQMSLLQVRGWLRTDANALVRVCATLLLSRGHHPKLVQELLGHASVAMTLDRYSHVLPGMGDQTAAAMEAALS
jgi:integrase